MSKTTMNVLNKAFKLAGIEAIEIAGSVVCLEGDMIVRKYADGTVVVKEILPTIDREAIRLRLEKLEYK